MNQSDIRGLPEGRRILPKRREFFQSRKRGSEPHSRLGNSPFVPEPGTGIKLCVSGRTLPIAVVVTVFV